MNEPDSYRDVQRFRQPWIWLIIGGIAALFWYMVVRQVLFGDPVGDRPAPDAVLLISWALSGVGLPLFFAMFALIIRVDSDGLHVRFSPFPGRCIPWQQITAAEVITYRPLMDFGGWGIRYGRGGRRAYTVSGNRGVELTLTDGKRIVLGSRAPDRLYAAIRPYLSAVEQRTP